MAGAIQFTGLGTGMDTKSIVDQLIQISSIPITTQQTAKQREQTRKSGLEAVQTRLLAVKTAADALRDSVYWAGAPKGVSGDDASYDITSTSSAAKAAYAIQVKRLATADVWMQQATSGVRQLGALYAGVNTFAGGSSKLVDLTSGTGTSLGLAAGQTITLNATKGGAAVTKSFTVTATSTLDELRGFIQTSIPGSSVSLAAGGRLQLTSPPGTDQEVTALSLSTGGGAALFDAAFASSTATRAATGLGTVQADDTLTITSGTVAFDVHVTAGMSMAQVAAAINSANGPVSAAVAGGRLRIAGEETGAASQVVIASAGSAATDLGLAQITDAQDALVNVDGTDMTTDSNEATDLIPGATVTLKATSTAATSATTDPSYVDKDELVKRVQTFADAYNALMNLIDADVTEKSVKDATTTTDKMKGTLFASSTLNTIRSTLRSALMDTVGGLLPGQSLAADVGITTAAYGTDAAGSMKGILTFDSSKLSAMFDGDMDAVKAIFANDGSSSATDGVAQRISDLALNFTKTDGMLKAAIAGSDAEMKRMDDQIDRLQRRVEAERARLETQFSHMETLISQLNSNSSGALSALANLSSSSS